MKTNYLLEAIRHPLQTIREVKSYINHRFIHKTHLIDTKLERGVWLECDDKLLFGMFNLMAEFVEVEYANAYYELNNTPETPITKDTMNGIKYIDEELFYLTEVCNEIVIETQIKNLKSIRELYYWWKFIRPAREDHAIVKHAKLLSTYVASTNSPTVDVLEEHKISVEKLHLLRIEFFTEDTERLQKLAAIRDCLWY